MLGMVRVMHLMHLMHLIHLVTGLGINTEMHSFFLGFEAVSVCLMVLLLHVPLFSSVRPTPPSLPTLLYCIAIGQQLPSWTGVC